MGDLSKHFSRHEFACKCECGFDTVDAELLIILEKVRERFGPVTINSACRCKDHNAKVGGKPSSQHLLGRAADIAVDYPSRLVFDYIDHQVLHHNSGGGLHEYPTFVHVDTRLKRARW
jgi:uncharacterized protein YcbK (DUF882 family)